MKTKIVAMIILSSVMGHYLAPDNVQTAQMWTHLYIMDKRMKSLKNLKIGLMQRVVQYKEVVFWQKLIMLLNRVPFIQR